MSRRIQIERNLRYWWNEFLFAHEFAYETEESPQAVAENLQALAGMSGGGWLGFFVGRQRTTVDITGNSNKSLDFEIKSARRSRGRWDAPRSAPDAKPSWHTYAVADGTISDQNKTGVTTIEGRVSFPPFMSRLLIVAFIWVFIVSPIFYRETMSPIIPVIFFVVIWLLLYHERNHLVTAIDKLIMGEKSKKAKTEQHSALD